MRRKIRKAMALLLSMALAVSLWDTVPVKASETDGTVQEQANVESGAAGTADSEAADVDDAGESAGGGISGGKASEENSSAVENEPAEDEELISEGQSDHGTPDSDGQGGDIGDAGNGGNAEGSDGSKAGSSGETGNIGSGEGNADSEAGSADSEAESAGSGETGSAEGAGGSVSGEDSQEAEEFMPETDSSAADSNSVSGEGLFSEQQDNNEIADDPVGYSAVTQAEINFETNCQTEWQVVKGQNFEIGFDKVFGGVFSYNNSQSIAPENWKWIIGDGKLVAAGTDSMQSNCIIYLGKYDITGISAITVNMGLNSNKPTVELLADCQVAGNDSGKWVEAADKNEAGTATKVYGKSALDCVSGGTRLGYMEEYESQSSWNGYDYSMPCESTGLTGEHDLYLKVTKKSGNWLGNIKGISFQQEYGMEVNGAEVTDAVLKTDSESASTNAQIDTQGKKIIWDTTDAVEGKYTLSLSGKYGDTEITVALGVMVLDLEGRGYKKEEVKCQTDWEILGGQTFEIGLDEAFTNYLCYRKEGSINPDAWKWIIFGGTDGKITDKGTDGMKDSCIIYLGKYDITGIETFNIAMGLNGNKPEVELWADCQVDETDTSKWVVDSGKNTSGNATIVYQKDAMGCVTGGTLLGSLKEYESQSGWNSYDYSVKCDDVSIVGEHDLYLKVTKKSGTWLGNIGGISYTQEYVAEAVEGADVTDVSFGTEDSTFTNARIDTEGRKFIWNTTGTAAGDYKVTLNGKYGEENVSVTLSLKVTEYDFSDFEREEVKYETEWELREGDLFEVDLEKAFTRNINYIKESAVNPGDWEWVIFNGSDGKITESGTDGMKDGCTIYLGKYDITAIDEFVMTMGLRNCYPTVELWADCQVDKTDSSKWVEYNEKNTAGNNTKIYESKALECVTGGTLLGRLSVKDAQENWNPFDYGADCEKAGLTGEHDLYLKVIKGSGTWLGNIMGLRYIQRYPIETIDGTEVTGITYQMSPETGNNNVKIEDNKLVWDTKGTVAGEYQITLSGMMGETSVSLTLNITVKERKQVIPAQPIISNVYQEREEGYQYKVVAGDTLQVDASEVLGKCLKSETDILTGPRNWEWIVLDNTAGLSLSNDFLGGRGGYTLYLGEYDITDLKELTLNLGAPTSVILTEISLLADCSLTDMENWEEAGIAPTEDANATVCYAKSALDNISGGTVICSIGDFADAKDGKLMGSGSFSSYKAYAAKVSTQVTGTHKLYLRVKASTTWFGNLSSVMLHMSTEQAIEDRLDGTKVSVKEELPVGAGIENGIFKWDTSIEQGGTYTFTLASAQEGFCPEKEIEIEVQDYPILPDLGEEIFWLNQKNELKLQTRNPDSATKVTYEGIGLPKGMEIITDSDGISGLIKWTPTRQQKGSYRIGIRAIGRTTSPVMYYSIRVTDLEEDIRNLEDALSIVEKCVVGYHRGEYTFYAKELVSGTLAQLTEEDGDAIAEAMKRFRSMVNTEDTGDVNGDGVINMSDLSLVLGSYGRLDEERDVDQSGIISLEDMVHIAKNMDNGIYRTMVLGADGTLYVTERNEWKHYVNTLDAREKVMVHFSLSQLPGSIQSVRLALNPAQGFQDAQVPVTVGFVEDDKTVLMDDAENRSGCRMPAVSEYGITATTCNGVLEADVTELVKREAGGDGEITFYLHSDEAMVFMSEDGGDVSDMPRLIVTCSVDEATANSIDAIEEDFASLGLAWPGKVAEDQNFANIGENGTVFEWHSDDEYVITDGGKITRAIATLEDTFTHVTLTAANGNVVMEKRLSVTVAKQDMADYSAPGAVEPKIEEVILEDKVQELVAANWMGEDDSFEHVNYPTQYLDGKYVTVRAGEDIQAALDAVSEAGGGVVILAEGIHEVSNTLTLRSNVTLVGYGKDRSIIRQSKELRGSIIDTSSGCVENFVFKDLSIEGMRGYENNASGLLMAGTGDVWHNRIMLQNVRMKNCGGMGIHIKRVNDVIMDRSEIVYSGESSGFYHNIYFLFNYRILQSDLDLSRPVVGKSCKYTSTYSTIAQRVTMRDGTTNAIQADNTGQYLMLYKYEIDNYANVALWFPCENYYDKYTYTEDPKYAMQDVILYGCTVTNCKNGGIWRVVENPLILNSYFKNVTHDLELLKCGNVDYTGSVFEGPDKKAIEYDRADLDGYYLTPENG